MIQVDISNIWGALSLRDLLGLEQEVFRAHLRLTEDFTPARITSQRELTGIFTAAERIREESEVLLVIGGCPGIQGTLELLQGSNRNLGCGKGNPQIFFTGNSLSTRTWNELLRLIEGKDFSLCVIGSDNQESAIAFRNLKWRLERRYGTDEARQRIFAVTTEGAPLHQMARDGGWETFVIPENAGGHPDVLSPAGLIPLAVAGIDIRTLLQGAEEAAEAFDLRSYENPVWLYAAGRHLLGRRGLSAEVLRTGEPDFFRLGCWWQQLFDDTAGLFPLCTDLTGGIMASSDREDGERFLETLVRFDPPEQKAAISSDVKDLDGLNRLSGSTLDQVEETTFQTLLETHTDLGIPLITIDCGPLDAHSLGQLLCFFLLSHALCRELIVKESGKNT